MTLHKQDDVDMDINEVLGLIGPQHHEALEKPSQSPQAAVETAAPREEVSDEGDLYDPLAGDEMDVEEEKAPADKALGEDQPPEGKGGHSEEQENAPLGVAKPGNRIPLGKSTALAGLLDQYSDEESESEEARQSDEGGGGDASSLRVEAQREHANVRLHGQENSENSDQRGAPNPENKEPPTEAGAHLIDRPHIDKNGREERRMRGESNEERGKRKDAGASGRFLEERLGRASDRRERRGNGRREERQASGRGNHLGERRHENRRREDNRDDRSNREWKGHDRRHERGERDRRGHDWEPLSLRGGPRDTSERGGSNRGERDRRRDELRDKERHRDQRQSGPPAETKSRADPPSKGKEGSTAAGVDLNEAVRAAAAAAARSAKLAASRAPQAPADPTEAAAKAAAMVNQTLMIQNAVLQQKRKMLWGDKKAIPEEAGTGGTNRWDAVAVGDSERTHKFQKLMGLKGAGQLSPPQSAEVPPVMTEEKQQQVQAELERQYAAGLRRRDGRTVGLGL